MGMDLWNSGLPFGTMGLLRDDRGCRQVDFGLGHVGPAWLPGCETSFAAAMRWRAGSPDDGALMTGCDQI